MLFFPIFPINPVEYFYCRPSSSLVLGQASAQSLCYSPCSDTAFLQSAQVMQGLFKPLLCIRISFSIASSGCTDGVSGAVLTTLGLFLSCDTLTFGLARKNTGYFWSSFPQPRILFLPFFHPVPRETLLKGFGNTSLIIKKVPHPVLPHF